MKNLSSKQLCNYCFRIYALILTIFSVYFLHFYSLTFPNVNKVISVYCKIVLVSSTFLSLFLIFKPNIWPLFCLINFFITTTAFAHRCLFLGLFFNFTSFLIAISTGYFRTNFLKKIIFSSFLFFGMLLPVLFIYDIIFFINALLASLFSLSIIILLLLIFSTHLEKILPASLLKNSLPTTPVIDLQKFNFTDKELYCIKSVIQGQPYKVIASDLAVSESVVKKMMCGIFSTFNVDTRERFVAHFASHHIIYPPIKKS